MLKLGWFSTGRGPGSRNLLKAVMDQKAQGKLDVEVSFVFCNWDNTEVPNPRHDQRAVFFDQVRGYGIPLITASWKKFRPDLWDTDEVAWRNEYGKVLRAETGQYGFDLGILAGYMLWMDDETCSQYNMLNLHPALPTGPKGTWEEVIWQLIRDNATEQGVMLHLCTKEWDRGQALTYCRFPIRGGVYDALWAQLAEKLKTRTLDEIREQEGTDEPLFRQIRADGAARELPLTVETIRLFADGQAEIRDKQLYSRGERLTHPYDLSAAVDRAV